MFRLYRKTRCFIVPLIVFLVFYVGRYFSDTEQKISIISHRYVHFVDNMKMVEGQGTSNRYAEYSKGYELARRLGQKCSEYVNQTRHLKDVSLNMKYETVGGEIQLCPVWKAGSTFLKRLFLMRNVEKYHDVSSPFNISFMTNYDPQKGFISNSQNKKRFLFVRNPYHRLYSSYVDKLYAPNPVYWRIIGSKAIKLFRPKASQTSLQCGHDLTFQEYVKYVIMALTSGSVYTAIPDVHFVPMTTVCKSCDVKYDFVGKVETFAPDVFELTNALNMSHINEVLHENMDELAADDAILDTVSQPFNEVFRNGFIGCISFADAVKRAWTKLQTRGLIGKQALNISTDSEDAITKEHLVYLARKAQRESSYRERRILKREYFQKMFLTISESDLENLRILYADDFQLFEYSDRIDLQ